MLTNVLKDIRMREFAMDKKTFCSMLGVNPTAYGRYEAGQAQPSLEAAIKISLKLNRNILDIWSVQGYTNDI